MKNAAIFLLLLTEVCAAQLNLQQALTNESDKLWGKNSAQANYRVCTDFDSCYKDACTSGASVAKREASRPFVMPSKVSPAKGTVVLMHGYSSSPYSFGSIAEVLSKRGYNVVTPLLSGHGAANSGACGGMTPDNWRADVRKGLTLASTLFPNTDLVLGGHSTGGALAVDEMQREKTPKISASLLYDPAMDLGFTNEHALEAGDPELTLKDRLIADALAFVGHNQLMKVDKSRDTDPARVVLPGECAKALAEIDYSTRQKTAGTVGVPTLAFFSNGKNESVQAPANTINAIGSRQRLYGSAGQPGILTDVADNQFVDYGKDGVRHNQITFKTNIGICKYGEYQNPNNPFFDSMAQKSADFLDRILQSGGQGPSTEAPADSEK